MPLVVRLTMCRPQEAERKQDELKEWKKKVSVNPVDQPVQEGEKKKKKKREREAAEEAEPEPVQKKEKKKKKKKAEAEAEGASTLAAAVY